MENNNDIYELPTNRFFNIFHMSIKPIIIVILLAIIIVPVIYYISNRIEYTYSIMLILYGLIVTVVKILSYPKTLDISKTTAKFEIRNFLLSVITDSNTKNSSPIYKYTVYNITDLKFEQTGFEKSLNVGSIKIIGKIQINGIEKEDIKYVTVHGIKDFADMVKWLNEYVEKYNPENINN